MTDIKLFDPTWQQNAAVDLNNAGIITASGLITANAGLASAVNTGTTAANLYNYGTTTFQSTSGAKTFNMNAPAKGIEASLFCLAGTTTNVCTVVAPSGVTFDGSKRKALFKANNSCLVLKGLSATRWMVKANTGSVTFSS